MDYSVLRTSTRAVTTLRPSRCQERAWWPMRSGQRIVSDEEEQVIGVPTAQVTSNMPVLGPSADPTPLRGLLIAIFVLLFLPRCRCTDLGKSNPNSRTRHIQVLWLPKSARALSFDLFQLFLVTLSHNLLHCPWARCRLREVKSLHVRRLKILYEMSHEDNRKFSRMKVLFWNTYERKYVRVSRIYVASEKKFIARGLI